MLKDGIKSWTSVDKPVFVIVECHYSKLKGHQDVKMEILKKDFANKKSARWASVSNLVCNVKFHLLD